MRDSPLPIVLVVDEDFDTRQILRDLLEHLGWYVLEAAESSVALAAALRQPPGLIIENHPMELEPGRTLTHALRSSPLTARVPILNLTSRATDHELEAARAAGVTCSIPKPAELARIIEAIHVLSSSRNTPVSSMHPSGR